MARMNFATLYGYMLLAEQGLAVHNPKYVERYGTAMWCLKKLEERATKDTTDYLRDSYTNSAESAKFFATYPADLSGKTRAQLYALRLSAKRAAACS